MKHRKRLIEFIKLQRKHTRFKTHLNQPPNCIQCAYFNECYKKYKTCPWFKIPVEEVWQRTKNYAESHPEDKKMKFRLQLIFNESVIDELKDSQELHQDIWNDLQQIYPLAQCENCGYNEEPPFTSLDCATCDKPVEMCTCAPPCLPKCPRCGDVLRNSEHIIHSFADQLPRRFKQLKKALKLFPVTCDVLTNEKLLRTFMFWIYDLNMEFDLDIFPANGHTHINPPSYKKKSKNKKD